MEPSLKHSDWNAFSFFQLSRTALLQEVSYFIFTPLISSFRLLSVFYAIIFPNRSGNYFSILYDVVKGCTAACLLTNLLTRHFNLLVAAIISTEAYFNLLIASAIDVIFI